jgi:hypothetical protein
MFALPPEADIVQYGGHVRFVPEADILLVSYLILTTCGSAQVPFRAASVGWYRRKNRLSKPSGAVDDGPFVIAQMRGPNAHQAQVEVGTIN